MSRWTAASTRRGVFMLYVLTIADRTPSALFDMMSAALGIQSLIEAHKWLRMTEMPQLFGRVHQELVSMAHMVHLGL